MKKFFIGFGIFILLGTAGSIINDNKVSITNAATSESKPTQVEETVTPTPTPVVEEQSESEKIIEEAMAIDFSKSWMTVEEAMSICSFDTSENIDCVKRYAKSSDSTGYNVQIIHVCALRNGEDVDKIVNILYVQYEPRLGNPYSISSKMSKCIDSLGFSKKAWQEWEDDLVADSRGQIVIEIRG